MYTGPRGLVQAGAVSAAGALPCPGDDHESGGCSEPLEAHGVLGDSASGVASLCACETEKEKAVNPPQKKVAKVDSTDLVFIGVFMPSILASFALVVMVSHTDALSLGHKPLLASLALAVLTSRTDALSLGLGRRYPQGPGSRSPASPQALQPAIVETAGIAATPGELAAIAAARAALSDDGWVTTRTDSELLRFVRSAGKGGEPLAPRLRETSAFRADTVPPATDTQWEFGSFFSAQQANFYPATPDAEGDFMEWLRDDDGIPLFDEEGAALLIVRPYRHKAGAIEPETWLRLVTWHAERVAVWSRAAAASDALAVGPAGRGSFSVLIDWRGAGLRNFDTNVLRKLLPTLARQYPHSLHKAYVAPINTLFLAVWRIVCLLLPKRATDRFTLISGSNWPEQLAAALGPRVASRLPPGMQVGGLAETVTEGAQEEEGAVGGIAETMTESAQEVEEGAVEGASASAVTGDSGDSGDSDLNESFWILTSE